MLYLVKFQAVSHTFTETDTLPSSSFLDFQENFLREVVAALVVS